MKLQGKNLRKHNLAVNKYKIVTSFICLCTGLLLALPFFVSLAKSKDSAIFIQYNSKKINPDNVSIPSNTTIFCNLSFLNQINFMVGNNPTSSATGDLDGDGKLDLVSSNADDNTVAILQNISSADNISFNTQITFPVGTTPFSVAVEDLDSDGKLDLAVANFDDHTISILRNTSTIDNISFISQGVFNVGSTPRALSISDLDGDNKPEIIVANTGSNNISILLNISTTGNISFAPQLVFGVGSSPLSVTPGDLDGDGKTDLAVSNFNGASLSILRNTSSLASITFATEITIFGFNNPVTVIQTDLTGDNKLDLAVTNFTSSSVSTLRNTSTIGNISFDSQDRFVVGNSPFSIASQDLDGDSKTDLVVSNNGDNSVSLLINTSTTTTNFAPQRVFLVGANPNSILLADLDQNNTFDVITCNSGSNDLSVIKTTCCPVITLTPNLLSNAIIGLAYNQQLVAIGGLSPNTFSFTGSLPNGISLSNSGLISGIPTQIGVFTITVIVQDANGCRGSVMLTLNVNAGTQNAVIFAADTSNNRIQKSTNEGTSWATVGFGVGVNVGQFNAPRSVANDFAGQVIFVADTGNNRIQRSTNGGLGWTVIASAGVAIGTVNKPEAIAYDSINDKLYIADTLNNRIQMVTNAKTLSPVFSLFAGSKAGVNLGQFNQPSGIAVDLAGRVYVADTLNNRIQFNTNGTSLGWSIFANATSGTTLGKVNAPRSIFVTSQNIVYVADTANNRIQVNNNGVSTGWSLFMGPGTMTNTVNAPRGVTVTLMGNVIIGDTGNNRVQRKPAIGGSATLVGGPGLAVGQFNQPSGVR